MACQDHTASWSWGSEILLSTHSPLPGWPLHHGSYLLSAVVSYLLYLGVFGLKAWVTGELLLRA